MVSQFNLNSSKLENNINENTMNINNSTQQNSLEFSIPNKCYGFGEMVEQDHALPFKPFNLSNPSSTQA